MRSLFEMVILITVAVILSFAGNALNPQGIPLFGQWNPDKGSVHAGGPCAPESNQISDLDVMDLYLSSGAVFVDARSQEDYEEGHIPRSINIPVGDIQLRIYDFMQTYPPDTRIIVYCSGVDCTDSHDVAEALDDYGFLDVTVYSQGYEKWVEEGRPISPERTER